MLNHQSAMHEIKQGISESKYYIRLSLSLVYITIGIFGLNSTSLASPPVLDPITPQPQETLSPMINIDWRLGPRMPKGLQDSGAGIIANTIVSIGGFNNGSGPGDRGFHNETWGLNLSNVEAGWQTLPNYPGSNNSANIDGAGRQGIYTTVVNGELYAWGGFNYTSPYTFSDGYKLSYNNNAWTWTALPSLPTPRSSGSLASVGTKIYALGGTDYNGNNFFTETDRSKSVDNYGAKFYSFDTNSPADGWLEMSDMPGTPRSLHATAVIDDKIYVFGGASNTEDGTYRTVVDNWMFDTTNNTWTRLRDLPIASGNFPTSGQAVIDDRYILLVGGFQYHEIRNPDDTNRPVYGTPSKVDPDNPHFSDIWVYDTQANLFGTASSLPLDNNVPTLAYKDGILHLIGGETGGGAIFGEEFAHHPDLYLIGEISVIVPEPNALMILLPGAATACISRRLP